MRLRVLSTIILSTYEANVVAPGPQFQNPNKGSGEVYEILKSLRINVNYDKKAKYRTDKLGLMLAVLGNFNALHYAAKAKLF